jgi:hypothetical protein
MSNKDNTTAPVVGATTGATPEANGTTGATPATGTTPEVKGTTGATPVTGERFKKRAREIFASHPAAKAVYFTSDGAAFLQASDAHSHAKTLTDRSVFEHKK